MKKKLLILTFAVLITLTFIIASLFNNNVPQQSDDTLVLKENNGQVVLFEGTKVLRVYDTIIIDVLPDSDKEALKRGITIENEEQLLSIIEDYDG
jgi:hypothetical protein